eukprot:TRINITY_DN47310_c0_g1_i1.p1 TRINITY_DN47310_c0_g1~~TRINITY_DN47310_c0_g1_i1.p1  ORF type:complete len:448 (-),score=105.31 TRINITY_DN47310_c0_g1_i1:222-1565(-)
MTRCYFEGSLSDLALELASKVQVMQAELQRLREENARFQKLLDKNVLEPMEVELSTLGASSSAACSATRLLAVPSSPGVQQRSVSFAAGGSGHVATAAPLLDGHMEPLKVVAEGAVSEAANGQQPPARRKTLTLVGKMPTTRAGQKGPSATMMIVKQEATGQSASARSAESLSQRVRSTSSMARTMSRVWHEDWIDALAAVVIVTNIITLGLKPYMGKAAWSMLGKFFAVYYVVELGLKLCLQGPKQYFCSDRYRGWNIFETILAVFAIWDEFFLEGTKAPPQLLKIARVAKLVRLVRLARFEMFRDLGVMLGRLQAGFRSMKGSFVLLIITLWSTSILLTQYVGSDEKLHSSDWEDFEQERRMLFSTVLRSFLTVFRCVGGDCSTSDGHPLAVWMTEVYGAYFILPYVTLQFLLCYGLLNLVSALFVESTLLGAGASEQHLEESVW